MTIHIQVDDATAIAALQDGEPIAIDETELLVGIADTIAREREHADQLHLLVSTVLDEFHPMRPVVRQCPKLLAALEALQRWKNAFDDGTLDSPLPDGDTRE